MNVISPQIVISLMKMTKTVNEYNIKVPDFANKNYILDVLESKESELLMPPRLLEANLQTSPPEKSTSKMVGIFSSGSSGNPKCIWNSIEKLKINAAISYREFDIHTADRVYILASPWHVAGLSWALMSELRGATWQIQAPYTDRIDSILDDVMQFNPTVICTVPSVVSFISQRPRFSAEKLIFGGGKIESSMYAGLFGQFSEVIQSYGQTEAGGLISLKNIDSTNKNWDIMITNVGKVPTEMKLEIRDQEIWLESPSAGEATMYFTGDLGYLDENNDLNIIGRAGQNGGNCNMLTAISEVLHK